MNSNRQSPQAYRFSGFELDPRAGELRKQGSKIKLQGQPLDILTMLLEHPGEVVTREDLQKRLWPADTFVDFEHSLNAAVKRLREALDDSADTPRFIETLPRRGYRFIGMLDGGSAVVPEGERRRLTRPWIGYAAIALVVLAGVAFALNLGRWRDSALHRSAVPRIQSIAVLPLENLSRDPEQDYFADGMTDALIADLAQISALRVISRTSVMRYKGTKKSLPEIARELNVDAVVEGTVLRSGERVRIIAQLLYAPTDRHLWAESYERDLRDVLQLQSELARAIADEVRVKLTPQEQARLAAARPVNPEAYEAYLRGRFHLEKLNKEGLQKALEYCQQSIRIDPNYAPAYWGVSWVFGVLGQQEILPPRVAYPQAREAALKAIELDPSLPEAHAGLGWIYRNYDWNWPAAEREFRQAIELDARSPAAHHGFSEYLEAMGRFQEALTEEKRAQELDPLSSFYNGQLALALLNAHHDEAAIEQARKTLELDPSNSRAHYAWGVALARQRAYDQAIGELRQSAQLSGGRFDVMAKLGEIEVRAGHRIEAQRILADLKNQSKTRNISPLAFATLYASLGENAQAFAWLERAYQERSPFLVSIRSNSAFDDLRGEPRFQNLLRRIGLPQ